METLSKYSGFYRHLWAKTNPYKALLCHMIDVGCCARVYLSSPAMSSLRYFLSNQWNCSEDEAVMFASYLSALHDIGKATPQFQMQNVEQLSRLKETEIVSILPNDFLKPVRHEYLSKSIVKRIWKEKGENRRLYDAYSCVLALHHQRIDVSERIKPAVHEGWKAIQDELERSVRKAFPIPDSLPKPKALDPVCILLTSILILCDWIASSGPFDALTDRADDYLTQSYEMAKAAMKRYGMIEDHFIPGIDTFCSMWPAIEKPRDIQVKTETLDPEALLTIIEAPMGEGKTEAALYVAARAAHSYGKRGIYVALPTQATSNQMYGRVAGMLAAMNSGHTRLLHGTAFLLGEAQNRIQSEDAFEAEKWLGTSRMGLLDENGVGTVDQAMAAVLRARFCVLRLLGLTNKALIIDELHAYDAYMSEIIESLLHWCKALEIPVILLSATLQNSQRERYLSCYVENTAMPELSESYPLITQVKQDLGICQAEAQATMKTEYHFISEAFGQNEERIAEFAISQIGNGGCYCIICNTVGKAQKVYQELEKRKEDDTDIMLFHARFLMGQRDEIEKECLKKFGKAPGADRPGKAILVATQVVEQSLDIDFDGMITELAPIDLLLQRAGRVHRHRNRVRPAGLDHPMIHVVLPDQEATDDLEKRYGPSGYVYDPFLLYNTEKLLGDERKIHVPDEVRTVIAEVYEHVSGTSMKAWLKRSFNEQFLSANADWITYPKPAEDYFFPTQSHPEFDDLEVDDGFDPAASAATRLGEPAFRIAIVSHEILEAARNGHLNKEQQKEILLSSVSLRLTRDIKAGLEESSLYQIREGALWGCYVAEQDSIIKISKKTLISDPCIGVYWEE